MKRIIKFKGKTRSGTWVFGDLVLPPNRFPLIRENYFTIIVPAYEEHEVIPETIGQFTGLYDKGHFEIYEGDLIKYKEQLCRVSFNKGMFSIYFNDEWVPLRDVNEDVELF